MVEYRRHQDEPLLKTGLDVILNEMGVDCWNRNKKNKLIPLDTIMRVIGNAGFDNGRWIIKVEYNKKVDYYFEDCLVKFNLS